MNAPHEFRAHALLSASSAARWLTCTPSARLTESMSDERSSFAEYGTQMHELAEKCLLGNRNADDVTGAYDQVQREAVQQYVDYVRAIPGERMIEQRLSYEKWVRSGFGTCDAVVISNGHLTIVDLKGGVGVLVRAEQNEQLMLYALAALDAYDAIYGPIHTVKMVIHQPRLDHVDEYETPSAELYRWADEFVRPRAELAWKGEGVFVPSEACQFCRARHTCRARAEINLNIAKDEMGEWCPPAANLSDAELAEIYPRLANFVKWANDLKSYCQVRAEQGSKFPGLKLVEGRSDRCIADGKEEAVIEALRQHGHDDYEFLNIKLAGITALEKLLGKKEFTAVLGDYIVKPAGSPTLVLATDKRPELDLSQKQTAIAEMSNV